jgi:molecular chaperone GrpE
MTERDRRARGEHRDAEEAEEARPRVKVTDRRRVRVEDEPAPARSSREGGPPTAAEAGGSAAGAGAPAAEAGPSPAGAPAPGAGEASSPELQEARKQAAEYLDHLQRLKAEFDNYRKRVLKEQTRAVEMAAEPLVRRLLEVLDEFDLALMAAERSPDFDRFLHGVELVYAKLVDILRAEGLERIEAEGKPFDPELHEALMQTGDGEGEPYVADVLRQGYLLKGRVIRPAGVKVARR